MGRLPLVELRPSGASTGVAGSRRRGSARAVPCSSRASRSRPHRTTPRPPTRGRTRFVERGEACRTRTMSIKTAAALAGLHAQNLPQGGLIMIDSDHTSIQKQHVPRSKSVFYDRFRSMGRQGRAISRPRHDACGVWSDCEITGPTARQPEKTSRPLNEIAYDSVMAVVRMEIAIGGGPPWGNAGPTPRTDRSGPPRLSRSPPFSRGLSRVVLSPPWPGRVGSLPMGFAGN
jgi:hypothetical protein